jgi:hypothetical protein
MRSGYTHGFQKFFEMNNEHQNMGSGNMNGTNNFTAVSMDYIYDA